MIGMPSHPLFPEQMDTLNGASFRNLLLASPGGKPRGSSRELTPFNIPLSSIRQRVAKLATPTNSEVFGAFHHPAKKESQQSLSLADSL